MKMMRKLNNLLNKSWRERKEMMGKSKFPSIPSKQLVYLLAISGEDFFLPSPLENIIIKFCESLLGVCFFVWEVNVKNVYTHSHSYTVISILILLRICTASFSFLFLFQFFFHLTTSWSNLLCFSRSSQTCHMRKFLFFLFLNRNLIILFYL